MDYSQSAPSRLSSLPLDSKASTDGPGSTSELEAASGTGGEGSGTGSSRKEGTAQAGKAGVAVSEKIELDALPAHLTDAEVRAFLLKYREDNLSELDEIYQVREELGWSVSMEHLNEHKDRLGVISPEEAQRARKLNQVYARLGITREQD
ncbi:hypothetical protein JCM10207_003741 [Rhodosporidiobolus poonsookiae]